MDTRYWIRKPGKYTHTTEEVASLMYLPKADKVKIADGSISIIEEDIMDNGGHIFKYLPYKKLGEHDRHGDYVKKIPSNLNDAQRLREAEVLFNMHDNEINRLRKKKIINTKTKRIFKKTKCKCGV